MQAEKSRLEHLFAVLFALCICAGIVICIVVNGNFSTNIEKLGSDTVEKLNSGWAQVTDAGAVSVTLPANIKTEGGSATLARDITAKKGTQLLVPTSQQSLSAFIDGRQIYSGAEITHSVFGYAMGKAFNIITIDADVTDAKLTLVFTSQTVFKSFNENDIYIGTPLGIIMHIIKSNITLMSMCFAIMLIGILLLLADIVLRVAGKLKKNSGFGYIGIFAMLSSFWIVTDSVMLQFISDNLSTMFTMSYFTFMLLPIPFLLYLHTMLEKGQKLTSALCCAAMLNYLITIILFVAGVALPYLLLMTHAVIIATAVASVYLCVTADEKQSGTVPSRELTYSIIVLCITGFLALISFYINPDGRYAVVFCIGLALFIAFLIFGSARKAVLLLCTNVENTVYNHIAYTDTLTSLANRVALERENNATHQSAGVAVFCMDITNLRGINAKNGYGAGNDILREFARCLTKAGADGNYRTDGDEFAAVLYNMRAMDVTRYVSRLEACVSDYNNHALLPISYTIGNAIGTSGESLLKLLDDARQMRTAKGR